jgi:hypothetical protein
MTEKRKQTRRRSATRPTAGIRGAAGQFKALAKVYGRVARHLWLSLDRSRTDFREIALLGRRYSWVSDRQRMVQAMLRAKPAVRDYVCADGAHAIRLRSLIESADEVSHQAATLPTALAVLEYIDHELGWAGTNARPASVA